MILNLLFTASSALLSPIPLPTSLNKHLDYVTVVMSDFVPPHSRFLF